MEAAGNLHCATIVFAKAPVWGTVKTRIARTQGHDRALAIYKELLYLTGQMLCHLQYHVAFTGAQVPSVLEPFFPTATSFFPQQGRTLGNRQAHAFLHCETLGYNRFCIVGCDIPTLTANHIAMAFDHSHGERDAAIGPAVDGGYYLIAGSTACIGLFDVNGWSTPKLLTNTLRAATRLDLCIHLLETKADIDTYNDYLQWKSLLP
jgi:uncharacterized protein